MRVVSRLASLVMAAAIIVLVVTGTFFTWSPPVIACQLSALALAVWARRTFAPGQFGFLPTPKGDSLLRRGPYRYIRHPMYAASMLLLWPSVLGHWSVRSLVVGAAAALVLIPRILDEERSLRERYPEYAEYARGTKALVPFVV